MSTDKTAPHWPHGTDYPESGPHAEGPSRVEEIRQRLKEAERAEASGWAIAIDPSDVAYLLAEVERLTASASVSQDQLHAALTGCDPEPMPWVMVRQRGDMEEAREYGNDEGRRETVLELLALADTLPTCKESDAELHTAGLEPGRVGRELRLRLEASAARLELQSLLVEGWEMPKPPGPRLEAAAWRVPDVGWVTQWVTHFGGSTPHEIPSPFRDGVRPTVEMFRALGFVTYE